MISISRPRADGRSLVPLPAIRPAVLAAARFAAKHWGLFAALALTFAVHAPTLAYYFDGDDFVVLGSAEYLGPRRYVLDSLLMRDIVPNWRPLTSVVYAAEWEVFGLNAGAWRSVNLSLHLLSQVLLYALVLRAGGPRLVAFGDRSAGALFHAGRGENGAWRSIAAIAAMIFGVSGAHFDTVTYVTALPHVLATACVLGSLLAMVAYAQDGERSPFAFWLSFALFVTAFLANEASFVYALLIVGAYALCAGRWRRAPQRLVLHAAPFAVLVLAWSSFYQSCTCEQLKFADYYWGGHVVRNYGVYLSWLVLPTRSVPLDPGTMRWTIAAAVAAPGACLAIRGPNIARIAVLGMALALLPYVPVSIWTASRYTYGAVAFFAPAAAVVAYAAFDCARALRASARGPATALGLAFVVAVGALYSWQTYAQDSRSGRYGERWELLASELRRNYADVPDGTTIYIVDGPWTNPMEQYTWVPGVARALYGDAAAFDLPRDAYAAEPPPTERAYFLEWTGAGLRPVPAEQVISPRIGE